MIKSLLDQNPWLQDPLVHEIPWRESEERTINDLITKRSLSFGVMLSDGIVTPHPPVQRAMDMTVNMVRQLCHKCIDWSPPSHKVGNKIGGTAWNYDGGLDIQ